MTARERLGLGAALLGSALCSSTAGAQARAQTPGGFDACAHLERQINLGLDLRQRGQDRAALELFRTLNAHCPSARILAQVGLAEQSLRLYPDAEAHLVEALSAADDPWISSRREALSTVLAEVRTHLGSLRPRSAVSGAAARVDDGPPVPLPLAAPMRVAAGAHTLRVEAPGHVPLQRPVTVAAGETFDVELNPDRLPVEPANAPATAAPVAPPPAAVQVAPAEPDRSALRVVGWSAVGVGAAAAIVGVVQWVRSGLSAADMAASTQNSPDPYGAWARYNGEVNPRRALDAEGVCTMAAAGSSPDARSVAGLCDDQSSARTLGLALGISGAVVAGAGLAVALWARPAATRERPPTSLRVAPWISPSTGGATLDVRF